MKSTNKVIAVSNDHKILVVLPYNSNGAYGTWELPRANAETTEEVLKMAVDYDGDLKMVDTVQHVLLNGETVDASIAALECDSFKFEPFHCGITVRSNEYPGMLFPAYVQAQFVSTSKALKMLKKSSAQLVAKFVTGGDE